MSISIDYSVCVLDGCSFYILRIIRIYSFCFKQEILWIKKISGIVKFPWSYV